MPVAIAAGLGHQARIMLTGLRIENFKAWRDTGSVRLAPLTIVFGANSSGKSSIGQLLLALKQTVQMSDRRRALHLGDAGSPIDLGTFADCLHGHDLSRTLAFALRWKLPAAMTVENSAVPGETYAGDEIVLEAALRADAAGQPQTEAVRYALLQDGAETLRVAHLRDGAGGSLGCTPLQLEAAPGRRWPAEPPEKFYRFADRTLLHYRNADFLADFVLEAERVLDGLSHLGPLRGAPRRVYQWAGETPADVGSQGEYAIAALLAAAAQGRAIAAGPDRPGRPFDVFIAGLLAELGIIDAFRVAPVAAGRTEYEVLVRTHPGSPEVRLTDVGFGISQVLPALVQAFYAPPGATVWMEQPEIHLHPMAQSNLADVFIDAIQAHEGGQPRGVQLVIETHSEHFLTRLQRRIAERRVSPADVAVYFVRNDRGGAELETLQLDASGEILNWPENFFGDEMADIAARALAAIGHGAPADGG